MQSTHTRWGHLIYLGFYFLPPLLQPTGLWLWLGLSLMLGIFVLIYRQLDQAPLQQRWYWLAGLVLVSSLATPINSGSMAMFAYVGFFIGFWCKGWRYVFGMLALLSWQALLLWIWWWQPVLWLQAYAVVVTLGVSVSGLVEQMRQQHQQQLERSSAELQLMARQLERERIARDLHDLMGHSLASIALKAELTEVCLDQMQSAQAKQQLIELQHLARQSLLRVRETISGYRQQGMEIVLPLLLAQLRSNGWQCHVEADLHELSVQCPQDMELILTELCTNLLKHSQGRQLWLKAGTDGQRWQLVLIDDGECKVIEPGHGLTGIQERLQAIGGEIRWQLTPTRFVLSWPVLQQSSARRLEPSV